MQTIILILNAILTGVCVCVFVICSLVVIFIAYVLRREVKNAGTIENDSESGSGASASEAKELREILNYTGFEKEGGRDEN